MYCTVIFLMNLQKSSKDYAEPEKEENFELLIFFLVIPTLDSESSHFSLILLENSISVSSSASIHEFCFNSFIN